jgi:hypothetical protein
VLKGEPGPPISAEQLANIPNQAELELLVAPYDDLLTRNEAFAAFVTVDDLPTTAQLDALLSVDEHEAFLDTAITREAAYATYVSKEAAPDPGSVKLLTEGEAEALFVSKEDAAPYTALARKDELPAPGSLLTAEEAAATLEPQAALDTLASPSSLAAMQPRNGPLSPALREWVRQQVRNSRTARPCPDGMAAVADFCIDAYEASVWRNPDCTGEVYGLQIDDYPVSFGANGVVAGGEFVYACSRADSPPSRFISWFQASQACAAAGKRLCSNAEWQMAAAGTPDTAESCQYGGNGDLPSLASGNAKPGCKSTWGVYNAAGNVAEWVSEWVVGQYSITQRWLTAQDFEKTSAWPSSYGEGKDAIAGVGGVVRRGTAVTTEGLPAAVVRGGSALNGASAGALAVNWTWSPSVKRPDIGFRCCAARY